MSVVGTCSQCGGQVDEEVNGTLRCRRCGSVKPGGQVIEMPPPKAPPYDPQLPWIPFDDWRRWPQVWC